MSGKKYTVRIDGNFCKGCWICVNFCSAGILRAMDNGKATVIDQDKCIGCRVCEHRCPDYAVCVEVRE